MHETRILMTELLCVCTHMVCYFSVVTRKFLTVDEMCVIFNQLVLYTAEIFSGRLFSVFCWQMFLLHYMFVVYCAPDL